MEKPRKTIDLQSVLVIFFAAVALVLGLKYLKQFFSLMITMLSLKFVWIVLLILVVLTLVKKKT